MNTTITEKVRFGDALGTRRLRPGFVEHDLPAKRLGAPTHTHTHEDEFSYIVSGTLTAQIGDEILTAGPGDLVHKPKGIPHSMWNAGDEPVVFLEVIQPSGFEEYFFDLAGPFNAGDFPRVAEIAASYGLDLDLESVPRIIAERGLEG